MKREYVRPTASIEVFAANEYCASGCGTSGTTYLFECDAGDKNKRYAVKRANGRVATISGMYLDGGNNYWFHPCGATHEAPTSENFLTGYHLDNPKTTGDENISVIIWTEGGTDVHCTTNLNMDTWEITKS